MFQNVRRTLGRIGKQKTEGNQLKKGSIPLIKLASPYLAIVPEKFDARLDMPIPKRFGADNEHHFATSIPLTGYHTVTISWTTEPTDARYPNHVVTKCHRLLPSALVYTVPHQG